MEARKSPKDFLATLDSISYQASRLSKVGRSTMSESILEKSVDLMASIVNYYTAGMEILREGLLSILMIVLN